MVQDKVYCEISIMETIGKSFITKLGPRITKELMTSLYFYL